VIINNIEIVPRDVFHALLEPKIKPKENKDLAIIRVVGKGIKDKGYRKFTIDLFDKYDEKTGFTAMQRLTGWHASIMAILAAEGKINKGALPVEKVASGKLIIQEAEKRGLKFSERWDN